MSARPICWLAGELALRRRKPSAVAARRYAAHALTVALLSPLLVTSCSDRPVEPRRMTPSLADLQIRASVAGTPVSTLVITVSASDIQPDLAFNIQIVDGVASGTIALPVGADRLVVVRAFDASGAPTHEGTKRVDVQPAGNPPVAITLVPLVGNQPIDVRIGSVMIQVTAGTALITTKETVALTARVTDLDGNPVTVNPADIRWATFDFRVASVDVQGLVTGRGFGDVQIVASYAGAAGATTITVGPAVLAAGDIGVCGKTNDEATAAILDTLDGMVLPLGDLAYEDGTLEEFNNCYHPSWGRHNARARPTPGNHDYHVNGAGYFAYFNDLLTPFGAAALDSLAGYYSYDVGTWHLVALNSADALVPINATSAQITWLKGDLAATTAKCVLAYWHHARFSSGSNHGSNNRLRAAWDELYAADADLVLVAHEHVYERFAPQTPAGAADPVRGIRQFTVGTGGASLTGFAAMRLPTSEVGLLHHGVLAVVLGPNTYSWRFISAPDGVVRDSGSGTCH